MPIETHSNGGATITGNAVNWFAVRVVLSAMTLYLRTGMMVNRSYTPQAMRDFSTRHTGKSYPRSKKGLDTAARELAEWVAALTPDQVPAR
jgi:hypothetical protein